MEEVSRNSQGRLAVWIQKQPARIPACSGQSIKTFKWLDEAHMMKGNLLYPYTKFM